MTDSWQKLYETLASARLLADFVQLLGEQAMRVGRIACQVGQDDETKRDALSEMRFCLSKADEAAKALMAKVEKANSSDVGGFQKGGPALA